MQLHETLVVRKLHTSSIFRASKSTKKETLADFACYRRSGPETPYQPLLNLPHRGIYRHGSLNRRPSTVPLSLTIFPHVFHHTARVSRKESFMGHIDRALVFRVSPMSVESV
jgi:hypothetical protein